MINHASASAVVEKYTQLTVEGNRIMLLGY